MRSCGGKGGKGSSRARRSEVGDTTTSVLGSGGLEVGRRDGSPWAKPEDGSSGPRGGEKRKGVPEGVGRVSVIGLKVVLPA